MKLKYYKITLVLLVLPFLFTSCELLGLDYQDSYDYDYDAGMPSNKIDMERPFYMQELKMNLNVVV